MPPVNLEDFRTFVNRIAEKTPDREIHHGGGWSSCAVGDFVREELEQDYPKDWFSFNDALLIEDSDIYNFLESKPDNADTYSELSAVLENINEDGNWVVETDLEA